MKIIEAFRFYLKNTNPKALRFDLFIALCFLSAASMFWIGGIGLVLWFIFFFLAILQGEGKP